MNYPLVLITTAYSIGIVVGKILNMPLWFALVPLSIFFCLALYAIWQKINIGIIVLVIFLLLGIAFFQISGLLHSDELAQLTGKGFQTISGFVSEEPKLKDNGVSLKIRPDGISGGEIFVWLDDRRSKVNYGDNIEVRGQLAESQTFSNPLMPQGMKIYKLFATYYKILPGNRASLLKKIAIGFRAKFNSVLEQILPPKEASLLGSILLGTTVSPIDDQTKNNYRRAGIIHLLVASGTQVSILIGVCLALLRFCRLPNLPAIIVTTLFNIMLVIVTGGGASILRAAIMGEVMLIGLLFERQGEIFTTLSISALVLLIFDPQTLFDLGFQLSFIATWALVYISPVFEKNMPQLLAVTLAPLLATTPIVAYNFSQVSPGGIISNLLVIPWVEFLTIFGFLTTVIGFFFLPLAQLLGNTLWLMLVILEKIVDLVPNLPGACFYVAAPSFVIIAGYYGGLIVLIEKLKQEEKIRFTKKRLAFVCLIIFSLFVWDRAVSAAPLGDKQLTVTFIDVGQGDSALIETPGGKKILIDGGGIDGRKTMDEGQETQDAIGEKVLVPFLHRKGINHLDLVILTHPHADHLGGLIPVLKEIPVAEVLDSGQTYNSQAYRRFKELVAANKIKFSIAEAGQMIKYEDNLTGYIFNPILPFLQGTNSDPNSNSIVMRLVYGDVSFLFTGDMEQEGEGRVLQSSVTGLRSTVLKVGHHGSRTATSDEFLKAVSPRFAVISCGAHNRYHHPHQITLDKLLAAGVKIYRTDLNGAIEMRTDGKELAIEPQK